MWITLYRRHTQDTLTKMNYVFYMSICLHESNYQCSLGCNLVCLLMWDIIGRDVMEANAPKPSLPSSSHGSTYITNQADIHLELLSYVLWMNLQMFFYLKRLGFCLQDMGFGVCSCLVMIINQATSACIHCFVYECCITDNKKVL